MKQRNTWRKAKLSELGFLGRGKSKHRPRNDSSLLGGIYPFIQTADVKKPDLYITEYSQTYNEKGLAQSKLWKPNTLCITIAANIAETAILKINACFPDSIVGFVADENKTDVKFIKYYIDTIKLQMQNVSKGTTQDNLSLEKIALFDLNIPPLETQKNISSILSAYDDLIENNTRRIKILEEMAQNIYKEWFVNFRFPNHKNVKFVDSELGPTPNGWKINNLGKILKLVHGYAFKSNQFGDIKTNNVLVRMGNFKESGGIQFKDNVKYLLDKMSYNHKYLLKPNDLVMVLSDVTREGRIIGKTGLIPRDENNYLLNQRVAKVEVDEIYKKYLLIYFNSQDFRDYCLSRANSATVLNLCNDHIYDHKIILPEQSVLNSFEQVITPYISLISNLNKKNENLRKTRDLLLPRLISGEIDVEKLEIA